MKIKKIMLAAVLTGLCSNSWAAAYTESGDAGSLVGSAQAVGAGITQIIGNTGSNDSEDLYRFTWAGGLFEASTDGSFSSSHNFDTMLFLFDSIGSFITANDDASSNAGSFISATIGAGDYLLGISGWSNDAQNAVNGDFRFGATGILDHWEVAGGGTGSYTIGLNSATSASVPEPTSLALLGLGFMGMRFLRKKSM